MTLRLSKFKLKDLKLDSGSTPLLEWAAPTVKVLGLFQNGDPVRVQCEITEFMLPEPIVFSISMGALPAGVLIDSVTGLISGAIEIDQGLSTFTVTATSGPYSCSHDFLLAIGVIPPPVWVTPSGLIDFGYVGNPVSENVTLLAIDPLGFPVSYYLTGGQFPPGAYIDPETGNVFGDYSEQILSNTEFDFTVSASNGSSATPRDFIIYVSEVPPANAAVWVTPAGSIGENYELTPIVANVFAVSPINEVITYIKIAGDLPEGSDLIANTGYFEGTLMAQPNDTTFKMILGAQTPTFTTPRLFTFKVLYDPMPEFGLGGGTTPPILGYVIENNPFSTQILVTSNPQLPLTFTMSGLPPEFQYDTATGNISTLAATRTWPNPLDILVHVSVTDGIKSNSENFLIIDLPDLPPVFDQPQNFAPVLPDFGTKTISTNLPMAQDNALSSLGLARPIVYSIDPTTPLPNPLMPDLAFDPNTGRVYGTLPDTSNGDVSIDLIVTAQAGFLEPYSDTYGNVSTQTFTITAWENVPPVWITNAGTLGSMIEDYTSTPFQFVVAAVDPHNKQTVTYQLTGTGNIPNGLYFDTANGIIYGTAEPILDPNQTISNFTVQASYISNGLLASTRDFSITVVKNYPPYWMSNSILAPQLAGDQWAETVYAADINNTGITYEPIDVSQLPVGVTVSSNTILGIFPDNFTGPITYNFTLSAADEFNAPINKTFSITSLENLPPVWITNAGTIIDAFEQTEVSTLVQAYDPEGYPIEYSVGNPLTNPEFIYLIGGDGSSQYQVMLNPVTGQISGLLPPVEADTLMGPYGIWAWDKTFGDPVLGIRYYTTQEFSIMVRFNSPPVFSSPTVYNVLDGTLEPYLYTTTVEASGVGNAPYMTYEITSGSLPPSFTMDVHGNISGTIGPVEADISYQFTVSAFNGIKTSYQAITFNIYKTLAPYWVTTSSDPAQHLANIAFGETYVASDPNGDLSLPLIITMSNAGNLPSSMTGAQITYGNPVQYGVSGTLPFESQNEIYTFELTVTNGVYSAEQSFSIQQIQDQPPSISLSNGQFLGTYIENYTFNYQITGGDPQANVVSFALNDDSTLPGDLVLTSGGLITGTLPAVSIADGVDTYIFGVNVNDGTLYTYANNISFGVEYNYPPVWVSNSGYLGEVEGGYTVAATILATDQNITDGNIGAPGISYTLSAGSLPEGLILQTDSHTGILSFKGNYQNPGANTVYEFSIVASDGVSEISADFSINGIVNQGSYFVPPAGNLGTFFEQTEFIATVQAISYDGRPITQKIINNQFSSSAGTIEFDGNETFIGMLPAVLGDENDLVAFTYTANNGVILNTAEYTFNIKFSSPPVFLSSPNLPDCLENSTYTPTTITAVSNGMPVYYSVVGGELPSGLVLDANSGVISGTTPFVGEVTTYTFTVLATTGIKASTQDFSIAIYPNSPPIWVNATTLPSIIESSYNDILLYAYDIHGLPITYSFQNGTLPYQWTFNATDVGSTCSISGEAPTIANNASYQFTIGASNGYIRTDQTFTLGVLYKNPPVWNTPAGIINTYVEHSAISFQFSATEPAPDSNAITFYQNTNSRSWPSWLSLTPSGLLTGTTPGTLSPLTYTFDVNAFDGWSATTRTFEIIDVHNTTHYDPYANTVALLMHMDEPNFLIDQLGHTITNNGGAGISTSQVVVGNASVNIPNGATLTTPYDKNLDLCYNSTFTVEFWVFLTSSSTNSYIISMGEIEGGTYNWGIEAVSSEWFIQIDGYRAQFGSTAANSWQHIAITRNGNNLYCFVNGILSLSATVAFGNNNSNYNFTIGESVSCYVDELRVTDAARYTGNFTPSTTNLPDPPIWVTPNGTIFYGAAGAATSNSIIIALAPDPTAYGMAAFNVLNSDFVGLSISSSGQLLGATYPTTSGLESFTVVGVDGNGNYTPQQTFYLANNSNVFKVTSPTGAITYYTASQTITLTAAGAWTVKVLEQVNVGFSIWGAAGGGPAGGAGGYANGNWDSIAIGTTLTIWVGGGGTEATYTGGFAGGFGGGGVCGYVNVGSFNGEYVGSGGGLSGVFLNNASFANAILIAGGGGGGANVQGGAGGGTYGQGGGSYGSGQGGGGAGPTYGGSAVDSGGGTGAYASGCYPGGQLYGGGGASSTGRTYSGSGGGGGYYGGGGGGGNNHHGGAGGGGSGYYNSAYISSVTLAEGNAGTPPYTSSQYYTANAAIANPNNAAGAVSANGLVVIYTV